MIISISAQIKPARSAQLPLSVKEECAKIYIFKLILGTFYTLICAPFYHFPTSLDQPFEANLSLLASLVLVPFYLHPITLKRTSVA